jgi:MFS family permease
MTGAQRILRALKAPHYGRYTAGSAISLIGFWIQRVAVGWLAWDLTHSGAWVGAIAFAELFPTLLLGPFAGVLADRWDRLQVMRVCQSLAMGQSLLLVLLTLSGTIDIWLLFLLAVFLGCVIAVNQPARLALVPSLVPPDDLSAAIAINSLVFNCARFVGPALAGLVIATAGIAVAFALNAASFAVFLAVLWRIRRSLARKAPKSGDKGVLQDLREGIGYAAGHGGIGPLLLLLIAQSLGMRPVAELLPGFAGEVFEGGAEALALLTASLGFGAMLGGLWLAQRPEPRGLTRLALLWVAIMGLAILGFCATRSLWLAVPLMAIAGFGMVAHGVGSQTLIQLAVDPSRRGRVLSLYGLIFRGVPAIGALLMGLASELVGFGAPLAVGTALALSVCALLWMRLEAIRAKLEIAPANAEATLSREVAQ